MRLLVYACLFAVVALIARPEPAAAYILPDSCNGATIAWSNLVPTFRANWFAGDNPAGDFNQAIQIINANPTNMNYWSAIDFGPHVVGMNNGHTEVWPYLELTAADIFNGDEFAAVSAVYLDGCDIDEGDVIFNLAYQWAHTTQKSDYDAYGDPSPDLSAKVAGVHELGHTLGFGHDCGIYNVMGLAWRHLWANGPDAAVYIGEPMTSGLVDVYGSLGPPTLQSPDVSVTHWQYDSCADGGYSEHRRTSAFNLAGDELDQVGGENEPRFIAAAGQTIEVDFTFENQGNTLEEGVEVGFYYSSDDTITTMDQRLGGTAFDFVRNDPDTRRVTVDLPLTLPQGDGYLGVIVDENDSINEAREHNNATYIGLRIDGRDANGDGKPDDGTETFYQYAAKVVCGVSSKVTDLRLRPGVYATTVNVFNPDVKTVRFDKRLAVSYPPDTQTQGETYEFGFDSLDPLHALETNCDDLIGKAFNGVLPQPYFEGFVVITSPASLDVTVVYSGSSIATEAMENQSGPGDLTGGRFCSGRFCGCGCCGCGPGDGGGGGGAGASLTLDVEQIRERIVQAPPDGEEKLADLIPIPGPINPGIQPETAFCQLNASGELLVTVRNQGAVQAQTSVTTVTYTFDNTPILRATAVLGPAGHPIDEIVVPFPFTNNCFMPNTGFGVSCLFNIRVDSGSHVSESNEGNNTATGVCLLPVP